MNWKRIYATYPERDNVPESRGWSREEISMMLRYAHGPLDRCWCWQARACAPAA